MTAPTGMIFSLLDYGARMYNPYLGRWFCADPAMQLLNPYAFCGNNPIVNVDPDGEFFLTILSAIFCPALLPAAMGIDMSTM